MTQQRLIYHGLVSRHSPLAIDLEIMRAAGFDGLEISAAKMKDALAAGITEQVLRSWLQGIDIPGIGFLLDIERHGTDGAALMRDAEEFFHLADISGAKGVQVLTGPVQVKTVEAFTNGQTSGLYEGVLRYPRSEQVAITARNLARLADEAARHNLLLYLEALAWSPLHRLADQVELIDRAGRDNVRMVIDYWHCYASGDRPENVAKIDSKLIYGVHICDSLEFAGGIPNEDILRNVPTGKGCLDLQEWTHAVKATGYRGWWSCELFCKRQQYENSFTVGHDLRALMEQLVRN